MILYMNRLLCLYFGLPLQYGGWRPLNLDRLNKFVRLPKQESGCGAAMTASGQSLRWLNYFLQKGADFDSFWSKYLESRRNILFIAGLGFDPRTCHAFQALMAKGGEGEKGLHDR